MLKLMLTIPTAMTLISCGAEHRDYRSHIPNHSFGADTVVRHDDGESTSFKLRATCIQFESQTKRLEIGVYASENDSEIMLDTRRVEYTILKKSNGETQGFTSSTQQMISPSNVQFTIGESGAFSINATASTLGLTDSAFLASNDQLNQELMARSEEGASRLNLKEEMGSGSVECKLR